MNSQNLHKKYGSGIFIYILLLLALRFFGGKFLIDFYGQPLKAIEESYFYWLSLLAYYPHYIIHHYWACVFIDGIVTILPILFFFFPKKRKWIALLFLLFFWIQTSTVEIFSVSHSKGVLCVFIAILPILFSGNKFLLLTDFVRYSGAFILNFAAYLKFENGALLQKGNYSVTLINQYYDYAILQPEHILYRIAFFIIHQPMLGDILYKALWICQVSFAITYFTRKFDKLLIINLFLFSSLTYVFMGIVNFDIFIIAIPLYFSIEVKKMMAI